MTQATVFKYLKHFGMLALLGAASVVLVALLQLAGTFNVSTLPVAVQGLAFLLLPIMVAAGQKVKAEVDAELAAEAAAAKVAQLTAKNAELSAKLVHI